MAKLLKTKRFTVGGEKAMIYGYPIKKIGIIGGGQLGKMLALKAKEMGFSVIVLDPDLRCPASGVADELIVGSFFDREKIRKLVEFSDVVTYEIETIDADYLLELEDRGADIKPSPKILKTIQNKYEQKMFLSKNNLPVPEFKKVRFEELFRLDKPFVVKLDTGGYDGRGVFLVNSDKDLNDLEFLQDRSSFVEKLVPIEKELAVIVARNKDDDIKIFPIVEMVFDKKYNILDYLVAPARVDESVKSEIFSLSTKIAQVFELEGVMGIEFFLSKDGKIYINELSPRPHNSGHYTIEGCVTSQFEQHIRAICNFPLGSVDINGLSSVVNILGEENSYGNARIHGLDELLKIEGAHFHFYGKSEVKPKRKLGHITIVSREYSELIEKTLKAKSVLKVYGDKGDLE